MLRDHSSDSRGLLYAVPYMSYRYRRLYRPIGDTKGRLHGGCGGARNIGGPLGDISKQFLKVIVQLYTVLGSSSMHMCFEHVFANSACHDNYNGRDKYTKPS